MSPSIQSLARRLRRPAGVAAAVLALALTAGVATTALARPGPWGHGGGDGLEMPGGMLGKRMLDEVNATSAQRSQIEQIMEAARADLKSIWTGARSLRQQTQALFAQPSIDANAAEALRQQELAVHDQVTKRMLQAGIDAANVLTPAQRQQLAAKMSAREALMQKQHAERAALDGAAQ